MLLNENNSDKWEEEMGGGEGGGGGEIFARSVLYHPLLKGWHVFQDGLEIAFFISVFKQNTQLNGRPEGVCANRKHMQTNLEKILQMKADLW